jgi:hypothetical protein
MEGKVLLHYSFFGGKYPAEIKTGITLFTVPARLRVEWGEPRNPSLRRFFYSALSRGE